MPEAEHLFERFGKACLAGELLFREGDRGRTMYVLQSGKIKISKAVDDEVKTLAVLGPGEFFGEMAILNDKPRTATAEVLEDAKLLVIDARTFEQMVVSNTEIAVRLIKKLARRLDSADALIEILMHTDPKARVILGLARESEIGGRILPDGSILVPLNAEGLAKQVGLEPTATDQVLSRLYRLGIVHQHADGLVIQDTRRLHEFLEFLEHRERTEIG